MNFEIHYSRFALLDIDEIYEYIKEISCSTSIAKNFIDGILSKIENLKCFPYAFKQVSFSFLKDIRVLPFKSYNIYYKIIKLDNKIIIERIYCSKRKVLKNISN